MIRIGRPPQQFCPKGHDTFVVGRTSMRHCKVCNRIASAQYRTQNPEKMRVLYAKGYERFKNDPVRKQAHATYKRKWKLQHEYNLTPQQEQQMLVGQEFKCAICKEGFREHHIDHDHRTNRVRGLLCGNCNRGLGVFKDSIENLQNAISYLQSSKEKNNYGN